MALSLTEYDGPVQKSRGRTTGEEANQLTEALKKSLETGKPFVWAKGVLNAEGVYDAKIRAKNATKARMIALKMGIGLDTGTDGTNLQLQAKPVKGTNGPRKPEETVVEEKTEKAEAPAPKPTPPRKAPARKAAPAKR